MEGKQTKSEDEDYKESTHKAGHDGPAALQEQTLTETSAADFNSNKQRADDKGRRARMGRQREARGFTSFISVCCRVDELRAAFVCLY